MKRAVCLVKDQPEIKAKLDELDLLAEDFTNKLSFLRKQAEKIFDQVEIPRKQIWEDIETILVQKGLSPQDRDKAKNLHHDKTAGVLFYQDNTPEEPNPLKALFDLFR